MVTSSAHKVRRDALVFGAAGPVRQAIANGLAKDNVKVWLAAPEDAGDEKAWRALVKRVTDAAGGLDIFVHAAPCPRRAISQCDFESFDRAFRESVGSLWLGATLCADAMRAHRGGAIIALSATVHAAAASESLYGAMFGEGVRALSASLGVAYANGDNSVRINALGVDASWLDGSFVPAPDQLGVMTKMVAFLASDGASYMNATVLSVPSPAAQPSP